MILSNRLRLYFVTLLSGWNVVAGSCLGSPDQSVVGGKGKRERLTTEALTDQDHLARMVEEGDDVVRLCALKEG